MKDINYILEMIPHRVLPSDISCKPPGVPNPGAQNVRTEWNIFDFLIWGNLGKM